MRPFAVDITSWRRRLTDYKLEGRRRAPSNAPSTAPCGSGLVVALVVCVWGGSGILGVCKS